MRTICQMQVQDIQDWKAVALRLLELWPEDKIILVEGDLGAGKTTLLQVMLAHLGYPHPVTSPTFGLVHPYEWDDYAVYHLDLYRLKEAEELVEIGIEDILYSKNKWLYVEWPELLVDFLQMSYVWLSIEMIDQNARNVVICRSE